MKNVYQLDKENHFLIVTDSDDHDSPNDWGNEDIFLVYDHRQFCVEREGFEPNDIYQYLKDCTDPEEFDLRNDKYDKYWIFPVYAYIHSGVSLSLSHQGDRFDVSSTGFILVEKENYIEGQKPTIVTEPEALKYAEGLIKTWNQYLSGEVYAFTVIEKKYCEHCGHIEEVEHDSCCGFYGDLDEELLKEMESSFEWGLLNYEPIEEQG